jgi:hypothetical protein
MNIKLNKPYKISPDTTRRYQSHYNIPAEQTLVVPIKTFGDQVSCDLHWQDDHGQLHVLQNKIIASENLVPVDASVEVALHELWVKCYLMDQLRIS